MHYKIRSRFGPIHKVINYTSNGTCEEEVHVKFDDAPPSSLMDLTASPKVNITEGGVGVCSLFRNTSRVKRHARAPGWD
jgi:hypothetical protein